MVLRGLGWAAGLSLSSLMRSGPNHFVRGGAGLVLVEQSSLQVRVATPLRVIATALVRQSAEPKGWVVASRLWNSIFLPSLRLGNESELHLFVVPATGGQPE